MSLLLATPLPPALAAEAREVVDDLRSGSPDAGRASALVVAVSEESLRYHFRGPIDALGVGLLTRKSLEVALDLALRGIRTSIHKVIGGLDEARLRQVADLLEERLYPDPHA